MHLQEPNIFGLRVMCFSRDPSCYSNDSYLSTNLCAWGVPWRVPSSVSSRILHSDVLFWYQTSRTPKIHGTSSPFGTTAAQRYDIPRDWLWDACHLARIRWGTCCKWFCSKEGPYYCVEQSARNPLEHDQVQRALAWNCPEAVIWQATIKFIHEFGNPLRIPSPGFTSGCTVLLSGGLYHAQK